jgi:hypothetical protein
MTLKTLPSELTLLKDVALTPSPFVKSGLISRKASLISIVYSYLYYSIYEKIDGCSLLF